MTEGFAAGSQPSAKKHVNVNVNVPAIEPPIGECY
jgi:hypothetical protein